jgi:hypothetical protein
MLKSVATVLLILAFSANGAEAAGKRQRGEGEMCGGIAGFRCAEGLWCDPEPGNCGHPDWAGRCVQAPEVCPYIYRPVCGCDGKTYGNDCIRRSERAAKRHDGPC